MSGPAISKHLKVLERAGLVETGRDRQTRPRHLVAQPLRDANEWLELYRPLWESTLDHLGDYVRELRARGKQPQRRGRARALSPKRRKA